ncbi:unnamed protein product [Caenorhabditis bovis]|uniref:F-box domain-containing protein n=1 Tax=Caenorhabditis bovis TaxID=2654633 RepID=A0A8S1EFC8_9PELO|nr:unnamed protein product [Caenorhabditis bovis]
MISVTVAAHGRTKRVVGAHLRQLDDETLFRIFEHLDPISVIACEMVCQRWNAIINDNVHYLPKMRTDQIRVLFDEGEVVVYPLDEKKCPTRYPMPSLQILGIRLRHLTTQSLFVRGLIPVESIPVLNLLKSLCLLPQQIYFIWSKFCPDSIILLEEFVHQNSDTVCDFGLEECSPAHLLTDKLLAPIAHNLTSLRLWNNGKGSHYAITDETLLVMADSIASGIPVETIDLATCIISSEIACNVVEAWISKPTSDLIFSLNNCGPVERSSLLEQLAEMNIFTDAENRIRCGGFTLTLFCS